MQRDKIRSIRQHVKHSYCLGWALSFSAHVSMFLRLTPSVAPPSSPLRGPSLLLGPDSIPDRRCLRRRGHIHEQSANQSPRSISIWEWDIDQMARELYHTIYLSFKHATYVDVCSRLGQPEFPACCLRSARAQPAAKLPGSRP